MGEYVPEVDVKNFSFRQICRLKVGNPLEDIEKEVCHLAVSNKYGLVFAVAITEIKVVAIQSIEKISSGDVNVNEAVTEFPSISIATGVNIDYISLNNDDSCLVVVFREIGNGSLNLGFIDVAIVSSQDRSGSIFASAVLSSSSDVYVRKICCHPEQTTLVAVVLSDGTVMNMQLGDDGTVVKSSSLNQQKPACAICWSPKGKQILIGFGDGSIMQYDKTLQTLKKSTPPPNFEDGQVKCVSGLHWLSAYFYFVVYNNPNERGEPPFALFIATKKDGPTSYTLLEDVYFGFEERRSLCYYISHVPQWNFLVTMASNAMEAAPLGKLNENWHRWALQDTARAECPLNAQNEDTLPVGTAISYNSTLNIKIDDRELPAAPLYNLLTTDGILCIYQMINQIANSPTDILQPSSALPTGVARRGTVRYLPTAAAPVRAAPQEQKPPSTAALGSYKPLFENNTGASISAASSQPFSFNMAASTTASAQIGGLPSAEAAASSKPSLPFGQTQLVGSDAANASKPLFSFAQATSSGATQSSDNSQTFAFSLGNSAAASSKPAWNLGATSNAAPFAFQQKPPPPSSFGATMTSNNDAKTMRVSDPKLSGGFASQEPKAVPAQLPAPVVAPNVNIASLQGSQSYPFGGATQLQTTQQPARGISATSTNIVAPNQQVTAPPNAFSTPTSQVYKQNRPPPPPFSAVQSHMPVTATHPIAGTQPPQSVPISQPPPPPPAYAQSDVNHHEEQDIASHTAMLDSALQDHIDEEITSFSDELAAFSESFEPVLKERNLIGTSEEMRDLSKGIDNISDRINEYKVNMEENKNECKELRSGILSNYKNFDEAILRKEKMEDTRYANVLKTRMLDPVSDRQRKDLRAQINHLENLLSEINVNLDTRWEEKEAAKRKTAFKKLSNSPNQQIFKTVEAIEQISQNLANRINALQLETSESHLHSMNATRLNKQSASKKSSPARSEQGSATRRFDQLRTYLAKREDTPVRKPKQYRCPDISMINSNTTLPTPHHKINPKASSTPAVNGTFMAPPPKQRQQQYQEQQKSTMNPVQEEKKSFVPLAAQKLKHVKAPLFAAVNTPNNVTVNQKVPVNTPVTPSIDQSQVTPDRTLQHVNKNLFGQMASGYKPAAPLAQPDEIKVAQSGFTFSSKTPMMNTLTTPLKGLTKADGGFWDTPKMPMMPIGELSALGKPVEASGVLPTTTNDAKPGFFGLSKTTPAFSAPAPKSTVSTGFSFGGSSSTGNSVPFTNGATGSSFGDVGAGDYDSKDVADTTTTSSTPGGLFGSTSTTSSATGSIFGSTATTSSATGGLFGNAAAPSSATGGLFGSTAAPSSATGGLFGNASTTSSATGGLFGRAAAPSSATGGLFGSATAPSSSTGTLFGSTATTSSATGGLFGSTATTSSATGSLFGSTATTSSATGSLFGSTATTSPATGGLFESAAAPSSTTGSLFGSTATTSSVTGSLLGSTATTSSATGSLFGSTATTSSTTGSLFGSTATTSSATGSLFGSTAAPSSATGGLFGSTATTSSATGSLFGNAAAPSSATGGLFGSTATTSSATGSLFGNAAAPSSATGGLFGSTATSSSATGSLFGNSATTSSATGGLFGNAAAPSSTTGTLFGNAAAPSSATGVLFGNSATTSSATGGLFGSATTTSSSTGSLFGSATAPSSTTGGLFGSTTTTSSAAGGLFGSTATPIAATGGLFGSTTTTTSTTGGLFGSTTTPSSATGGLFGSVATTSSASGGIFGSASAPTAATGGLFGSAAPSSSATGGLFGSTTTPSSATGGLFGSVATTSSASGGIFGSASAPTAATGGLFGSAAPPSSATGGLFGSTAAPSSTTGSLFGSTATTSSATGSLFGSTAPPSSATGALFGSTAAPSSTTGSLFGSTTTTSSATGGLFGSTTTTSSATGGLFGTTATPSSATGGLFGSTAAPSSATGGLFGSTAAPSSATGGLFGSTATPSATTGGLFGNTSTSGTSLFGTPKSSSSGGLFGNNASTASSSSGFNSTSTAQTSFGGGGFGLGGKPINDPNKNPFGSAPSTDIASTSSNSLFSGSSTSGFGQTTSNGQAGGGSFSKGFGAGLSSPPSSGFGSSSGFGGTQAFGGAPAFGSPSAFGAAPVFGGGSTFGSSPPNAAFGGGASFGAAPTFGSNTAVFGSGDRSGGGGGGGGGGSTFGSLATQATQSPFGQQQSAGNLPSFGSINTQSQQQQSNFGGNTSPSGNQFSSWR